jgi:hypothetical protein
LAVAAAATLTLTSGCAKKVDPDGEPAGARPLALETWKADSLDCKGGDCADWYRFEATDPGHVTVEVVAVAKDHPVPAHALVLADGTGTRLGEAKSGAGPIMGLEAHVEKPGSYLLEISEGEDAGPFEYQLRVNFQVDAPPPPPPQPQPLSKQRQGRTVSKRTEPPPPPPPPLEKLTGTVLKIEGSADKVEAVVISLGTPRGMKPGMRGRVLEHGRTIANIEIVEVYRDGSRARVDGYVSGSISPAATVEIDAPKGNSY